MKGSKNIALKDLSKRIKAKRKLIYKYFWKHWDEQDIMSGTYISGNGDLLAIFGGTTPAYICELRIFRDALFHLEIADDISIDALQELYRKWKGKINLALCKRALRNGGKFPEMCKTDVIKEFLARGFVHFEDAKGLNRAEEFYVSSTIADLVYPEGFEDHLDCIAKQMAIGIPGYTSAKQPLNKK